MLSFSIRIAGHTLVVLRRIAIAISLLFLLAAAGLILVLRYTVLPQIEQYHGEIVRVASKALGQDVEVGKIEADWQGIGPRLHLSDIRLLDANKRTTLTLQSVDAVVSWMTLLSGELRLASLEIDEPDLLVKRDVQGNIRVSGVAVDETPSENKFADLLLSQSHIVVRNAHISWMDETRSKQLLIFNDVNLQIENGWNRHRFAMRARPPLSMSSGLDVRGEMYGKSFDDLQGWRGEIYTQLDYADIAAWRSWLPLPGYFKQGRGAVRGWLGIDAGKPVSLTTDLALVNVQTRLDAELPPLNLRALTGRLGWQHVDDGFEVSMRKLSLELADGFVLQPTDALFRLSMPEKSSNSAGELQLSLLELEGAGKLLDYLPLEQKLRNGFAQYQPRGHMENVLLQWQRSAGQPLKYQIKGKFSGLAMQRVDEIPGFAGISGEIDGTESKGVLSVEAKQVEVDAPRWMQGMLAFDSVSAQASWQKNARGIEVKVRNLALTNEDITGTAYGSYQTLKNSPGVLDLNVQLTHVAVPRVARYIPLLALGDDTRRWLNLSLLHGTSRDASVRIRGDLNDFPFAGSRKGLFKVHARASDVALEYASDWPRIEHGNVELTIQGRELSVLASSAKTLDARLQNVRVEMPDLMAEYPVMEIHGEATAENRHALEFVQASPVRGYLNGFTDTIRANGQGRLSLHLHYPFREELPVKVTGNYHFTDSDVELDARMPVLRKVNGDLQFTEHGASTNNIEALVLGGPAKLQIDSSADGAMNIRAGGRMNLAALRKVHPQPVLERVSGSASWNLEIGVQNKLSRIVLNSNMQGLQSELPAPLSKQAEEIVPLQLEIRETGKDKRSIVMRYGNLLNAHVLQQQDADKSWRIERGLVNFGNVAHQPDRKGLWIIGTLPHVSLEGWGALSGLTTGKEEGAPLELAGADFTIQKLTGFGNRLNELHVKAATRNDALVAQLSAREINGEVSWQARGAAVGGQWYARLKNLELGLQDAEAAVTPVAETTTEPGKLKTIDLPAIDMMVERLTLKGRQLGRLELQAQQKPDEYVLNRLRLSNPDGVLDADGMWSQTAGGQETKINMQLDIGNAGNVLARSGFPNSVRGGNGKMNAALSWPDAPWLFDKEILNGSLNIDTGTGQFLQIDPGAGKLLSILSLQALPKRIALDFDDVFSKGFEFDSIKGSAQIKNGVMSTDNLKIEGSAAKVFMAGQVNLKSEQQDLRVRIVPTVGNSAALLTALMATPVVGAGVFLASKILDDPLGQLVSFEYNISGNWADPKVEKVTEKKR